MFDTAPEHIKNKALAELRSYMKTLPRPLREKIEENKKEFLDEIVKSYIVAGLYRKDRE